MGDHIILKTYNLILIRYNDEIWLKSNKVKLRMIHTLIDNIKSMLGKANISYHKYQMSKDTARIFFFFDNKDIPRAIDVLKRIFGIHSFSPALRTSNRIKNISERSIEVAEKILEKDDSFALRVKRSGLHDFTSQDVANQVGQRVLDHFKDLDLKVNLGSPDKKIFIEVRNKFSYIFTEIIENQWKGLPIEYNKKLIVMDIGRLEDLLAGFFLMRRGCIIYPILFKITDKGWEWDNRITNWKKVFSYTPFSQFTLIKIDLVEIFDIISEKLKERKYFCALCRLIRFKIISEVLESQYITGIENSKAITDGLNLNDNNLCPEKIDLNSIAYSNNFVNLPIFTPLIGLDLDEVNKLLKIISNDLYHSDYCKYKPKKQEFDSNSIIKVYNSLKSEIKDLISTTLKDHEIIIIK
jgi:thiamine biosynthesis protein ThiI